MSVAIDKRRRVLIVDDERVITDTLVTIFSQRGYETQGVYSAEQALVSLEDWHPDLVVIDVLLPAMNGIDLAIRIRSQWPECHTSLVTRHSIPGMFLVCFQSVSGILVHGYCTEIPESCTQTSDKVQAKVRPGFECQKGPNPFPCRNSDPGFKYKTHGGLRDLTAE